MNDPPNELLDRITASEGINLLPYTDSMGILTIGIGHNLTVPISIRAADFILADDLWTAQKELRAAFPWVTDLDAVRYWALVELTFNMGLATLKEFDHMLTSLARGDVINAAAALLQSRWAEEVGVTRSERIANQLRDGQWH